MSQMVVATYESNSNEHTACVHRQFTIDNTRTNLVSLYPKFDMIAKSN